MLDSWVLFDEGGYPRPYVSQKSTDNHGEWNDAGPPRIIRSSWRWSQKR